MNEIENFEVNIPYGMAGKKTITVVRLSDHAKRVRELEEALREIRCRIETMIGTVCKRCERGDQLFVEPSTGNYTHSLGGNYCDAHTFHSLLNTEVSKQARAALRK